MTLEMMTQEEAEGDPCDDGYTAALSRAVHELALM